MQLLYGTQHGSYNNRHCQESCDCRASIGYSESVNKCCSFSRRRKVLGPERANKLKHVHLDVCCRFAVAGPPQDTQDWKYLVRHFYQENRARRAKCAQKDKKVVFFFFLIF